MRQITAIIAGKLIIWLTRLAGNQGTVLPGRIARRICPDILNILGKNINYEIIAVTGTNGKTTTSNMIAQILKEKGYTVVHNKAGANMLAGITTAFIEASNIKGNKFYDYALLETDEANVPLLLKELSPRLVLITNFFRDQLDRYGELDHTINLIKDAVRNTKTELVLNADDPLVAHFHKETGLHCWYFGFDDTPYDTCESTESREGRYCVFCGAEICYESYHYAQLGKFYCPNCSNQNPPVNFKGKDLHMNPELEFKVNDIHIISPYQGFYNAYNILAAVSIAKLVGIQDEIVSKAIEHYKPQAGRMEHFIIDNREAILILVKNPTGLNQSLEAVKSDLSSKNMFFALNDNAADGRDVSWIWDANIETILETDVLKVVCSGQRSGDIAVRLKYCGVDKDNIIIKSNLREGIETAVNGDGERTYILSTYTALFECRKILLKLQKNGQAGERAYINS